MMTISLVALGAFALFVLLFVRIIPRDIRIVDGDTIKVKNVSWRLTGFDAPEYNQPGGTDATRAITRILRASPCVAFVRSRDAYGRPLATIFTSRGLLSWRMTASGNAHGEGFIGKTLTAYAWLFKRGLWSRRGKDEIVHPRIWRARFKDVPKSQRPSIPPARPSAVRVAPAARPQRRKQAPRNRTESGPSAVDQQRKIERYRYSDLDANVERYREIETDYRCQ